MSRISVTTDSGVSINVIPSSPTPVIIKRPGVQGVPGPQGQGIPGQAASVTVGSVTTLAPDQQATVSNVGTSSAAVFNFGIPQGAPGENGAGTGTVTSVGIAVPAGFSVSGSPISSSGVFTITYDGGYQGYTSAEASKLSGIAPAATANSSDATLLDRANHTGQQSAATISDFNTSADARISAAIGSTVQGYNANLTTWAGVASSANGRSLVAANYATMRALLDLEAGTDFLSPSAIAAAYAALVHTHTVSQLSDASANGRSLISAANYAAMRTLLSLVVGTDVQAYDAATLKGNVEDQAVSGGARITLKDLGNLSGASITPDPGDRPTQKITNNGAGSILPGSNYGSYRLLVVNASGAGAITTTGWVLKGDSFDTTTTSKFLCGCDVYSDMSVMTIVKVA